MPRRKIGDLASRPVIRGVRLACPPQPWRRCKPWRRWIAHCAQFRHGHFHSAAPIIKLFCTRHPRNGIEQCSLVSINSPRTANVIRWLGQIVVIIPVDFKFDHLASCSVADWTSTYGVITGVVEQPQTTMHAISKEMVRIMTTTLLRLSTSHGDESANICS